MVNLVSTNPGKNYEVIGELEVSSEEQIQDAVFAAREAAESWKNLGVSGRLPYIEKLKDTFGSYETQLSELQTAETGKVITQSVGEFRGAVRRIDWLIENAPKYLAPETLDETDTQITKMYKEPYGVAAVIVPWNYPTALFVIGAIQKLICGNTIVFKHSEECALTSKLLEEIISKVGFPEGVFNFVHGAGDVGQMLVSQDIDLISFTGSSAVGMRLYKLAAEKFIVAKLELGGSSPGVIFDDADLDTVIGSCCEERFEACGQVCCALKRLIVHESVLKEVTQAMKESVEGLIVGDPMDPATQIGSLVARRQQELLQAQVDDAVSKGAKVVCGGVPPEGLEGAYFLPTILSDVTPDMRVWQEEVFGPVLPIVSFETEEEAIALANDTEYGLSAFVYSADSERALRVARTIDAGQLSVNSANYFSPSASFGGFKASGIGRAKGRYGFYESTQAKVIATPKND